MGVAALLWHLLNVYAPDEANLEVWQWIGLGLTVVVFGTWGDLVESLFKRTLGIKDSGNILPAMVVCLTASTPHCWPCRQQWSICLRLH